MYLLHQNMTFLRRSAIILRVKFDMWTLLSVYVLNLISQNVFLDL